MADALDRADAASHACIRTTLSQHTHLHPPPSTGPIPWLIVAEMFDQKYVATAMSVSSQVRNTQPLRACPDMRMSCH